MDELFQGAREELGLPEPQMRRYEVTAGLIRREIQAEDYDHDHEAATVVFTAAGRKVYEVARGELVSIADLGPATVAEEKGDEG